jgi:hypothetical protein
MLLARMPRHYRFKWPDHAQLKFLPSMGHLLPAASKRVTATFSSAAPLRLDGHEIKLQVAQIQHKGAPADWDDVIAAAAAAAAPPPAATPAAAIVRGAGARGTAMRATPNTTAASAASVAPGGEPLHDVVPKTQRDIVLKVGLGTPTPTTAALEGVCWDFWCAVAGGCFRSRLLQHTG